MGPSLMGLSNRVDLYRFLGTQDEDAGLATAQYGAAFATSVACSIQPGAPIRLLEDGTARIVENTPFDVFFAADYSLATDDKIVGSSTDPLWAGVVLIVSGTANQAGKGNAYVVTAQRKQ